MFFLSGDSLPLNGDEIMIEADNPTPSEYAADSVLIKHGFNNVGGVADS